MTTTSTKLEVLREKVANFDLQTDQVVRPMTAYILGAQAVTERVHGRSWTGRVDETGNEAVYGWNDSINRLQNAGHDASPENIRLLIKLGAVMAIETLGLEPEDKLQPPLEVANLREVEREDLDYLFEFN